MTMHQPRMGPRLRAQQAHEWRASSWAPHWRCGVCGLLVSDKGQGDHYSCVNLNAGQRRWDRHHPSDGWWRHLPEPYEPEEIAKYVALIRQGLRW